METALTINDFIRRAEMVYGDRVAVIDEPDQPAPSLGAMTWAEFADRARGHAAWLDDLGVAPGSRVAIASQNSARMLLSLFGVSGSGRVLVPINFRLVTEESAYIVEHSGAEVVLIDPELTEQFATIEHVRVVVLGEDDDAVYGRGRTPAAYDLAESETATINYTSGTTARPKGVQLTHRNLWVNATVFALHLSVNDRDVYLHTLPLFHVNGWGMPYGLTGMGSRHVILRKVDGAEILRRIEAEGVTLLCGAPAVISMVLEAAADWDGPIPGDGQVRVVVAGAPPPTSVIESVETELGWEFIQIYGLTETAPLLTFNRTRAEWDNLTPRERAVRLGRAGAPAIGVEIDMTSDGEVIARSSTVMASYWENPEVTAEALKGGWFQTGDGGFIDEDGYLSITDRKKDVIISGGENVSSIEVEDVLLDHPAIREVAVIGIPDKQWGELVTALIVADGAELTAQEVTSYARERLAGFKIPRHIEFRDELARTVTGKLQKAKLREPFWEGFSREVH